MARTYTLHREYKMDGADVLARLVALEAISEDGLKRVGSRGSLNRVAAIGTAEDVEIKNELFTDCIDELRLDALTPNSYRILMRMGTVGNYSVAIFATNSKISVDFSDVDEGVIHAIAARMDREMAAPVKSPASAPATPAAATAAVPEHKSWFKATWGWIATIVAAVIAGAILKALGLV